MIMIIMIDNIIYIINWSFISRFIIIIYRRVMIGGRIIFTIIIICICIYIYTTFNNITNLSI